MTRPDPAVQQTMQVGGTTRYFLTYLPTNYSPDAALPLVFVFHGLNMNNVGAAQELSTRTFGAFGLKSQTNNQAILVYPQGSGDVPGNLPQCGGCTGGSIASMWNANAADLGFFDALLASVESTYCVDTSRVFATGFSMGGMFTNALGCQRGNVLRGIAPVEGWGPGSPPTTGTPTCTSGMRNVAALVTHGTADSVVPYVVGQASATFWAGRNACTTTTMPSLMGCVSYQGCRDGLPTAFCTHAGDHVVPAAAPSNIWTFFTTVH